MKSFPQILKEGTQSEPASEVGEITHTWRGCCGGICSCCISGEPDFVTISCKFVSVVSLQASFLGRGQRPGAVASGLRVQSPSITATTLIRK